jgi:hypothetical protein
VSRDSKAMPEPGVPFDEIGRMLAVIRDPNTVPYSEAVAAGLDVTELGWSHLTATEARDMIRRARS